MGKSGNYICQLKCIKNPVDLPSCIKQIAKPDCQLWLCSGWAQTVPVSAHRFSLHSAGTPSASFSQRRMQRFELLNPKASSLHHSSPRLTSTRLPLSEFIQKEHKQNHGPHTGLSSSFNTVSFLLFLKPFAWKPYRKNLKNIFIHPKYPCRQIMFPIHYFLHIRA